MNFPDFLRALGYDPWPYSGRGMSDDDLCWSLRVPPLHFMADFVAYEREHRLDHETRSMVIKALRSAREDSMGRGSVLYFPSEKVGQ